MNKLLANFDKIQQAADDFYEQEIVVHIPLQYLKWENIFAWVFLVSFLSLILCGIFCTPALVVGVPFLFGITIVWVVLSRKIQPQITNDQVCQKIADALQMQYTSGFLACPPSVQALSKNGFAPNKHPDFRFSTTRHGYPISLHHIHWITEDNEGNETHHNAFAISCPLRKPVSGETLLVPDGVWSKVAGACAGLKRAKLEWLEFEKQFDLFTTDEKEVRVLMAPDVMAVLHDVYKAVHNSSFCFAFQGPQFCLYYPISMPTVELWRKENIRTLFINLYLVCHLPEILQHKLVPLSK